MSSHKQWLSRNFKITYQLLDQTGLNVLDANYRPNWRTFYCGMVVLIVMGEMLFLLATERSDPKNFLLNLLTFLFAFLGLQNVIWSAIQSGEILALRAKLAEIQDFLDANNDNGQIICKVLRMSHLLQKFLFVLYMISAVLVLLVPIVLRLTLGKTIILFVFFVPRVDVSTSEGFLLHLALHSYILLGAYCVYTAHESLFIAFIMPIGAYVNAFGNEVKELNSMLTLPENNNSTIRDQLNRLIKLHQLLNEYEEMLEDLYKFMVLEKVGLIYLGIISAILVILTMADPVAYIFLALLFEQLTKSCLMGTIITVKNDQLMAHIYEIYWYRLSSDQAIGFMLHKAQNPTSVTIGTFAPLNVESYQSLVYSIYSYVMVLITFLK